jgi:hypothetical protein
MLELYTNRGIAEYLDSCIKLPVVGPRDMMHETFCCKKRTFRYLDPNTRDEVALVSYVTDSTPLPKPGYIIVGRMLIDGQWYEEELPDK